MNHFKPNKEHVKNNRILYEDYQIKNYIFLESLMGTNFGLDVIVMVKIMMI